MSTKSDLLKSISSEKELKNLLINNGGCHQYYHHYTTLENLACILENESFLLTRLSSIHINDLHEGKFKGTKEMRDKTYIASFAFGKNENMAMWGLYCKPWERGVRISIPKKEMTLWINGINSVKWADELENYKLKNELQYDELTLNDIVYIGKNDYDLSLNNKLYWSESSKTIESKSNLVQIDSKPGMTGFIKNAAWKYENEVRVRVCLHDTECENDKIIEKIGVKIPTNILESFIITTGPYYRNDVKEDLKIKGVLDKIDVNNIRTSKFEGLLNYKNG